MSALLLTLLLAILLDLLFGDPGGASHPVAVFGRYAARVEGRCRRLFGNGILSGLLGWLLAVLPVALGAWATTRLAGLLGPRWEILTAGLWLYFTIAFRSLITHTSAIRRPLLSGNLTLARKRLSMIVSRDTENLGHSDIVRGGIESLSENLVDAVTSALFWGMAGFVVGGLPGLAAGAVFLRTANTLDAMWGYRNARYLTFGRIAARADDLLHFLPARLTTLGIALAAPLFGGGFRATLRTAWENRHTHPSWNSVWSMAAFAAALGIRLGGATRYGDTVEEYPAWGNGRSRLVANDILRAQQLAALSMLSTLLLFLVGVLLCR